MSKEEQSKKMGQIVKKAWEDESFKQRLLADATSVFKEHGLAVPGGLEVKVVENTEKVYYFVIPQKRNADELDENFLDSVSGGGGLSSQSGHINNCPRDACDCGMLECLEY